MIDGVAIKDADGKLHSLPKPNRHHHVIKMMVKNGYNPKGATVEQGFVDANGQFYNRTEAARYVLAINQVDRIDHNDCLYTEDLW